MSLKVTLDDALRLGGIALAAIRGLVKNDDVRTVVDIVDGVRRVIAAIDGAADGRYTPEQATRAIDSLMAELRSNDATADAALVNKFKTAAEVIKHEDDEP